MAAREDECKEAPTRTRTQAQAQTRDPALYVLFQRYAGLGQDHFGPSDRDAMSLSNFSSLMRDAGVDAAPGAVAVAFEQRAIPGRRRGLTDFDGFVHIVRELAVESGLANGEEAFVHHLQRKNPRAWAEAIQAWAARQPRSPRERPLDMEGKWAGAQELHQEHQQEHQQKAHEEHQKLHQGGIDDAEANECEKETVANETCEIVAIENVDVESALKRDIFAFYANEADNRLTFTSFVQFTRDFQLHPRLCSRRSLVRAFQTAAGTETLTMQDFDVALENLAEAIFAHSYVAKAVRERPRETLMDFLRSYCELIAEIREELRNRPHANHRVTIYPDGTIDVLRAIHGTPEDFFFIDSHAKTLDPSIIKCPQVANTMYAALYERRKKATHVNRFEEDDQVTCCFGLRPSCCKLTSGFCISKSFGLTMLTVNVVLVVIRSIDNASIFFFFFFFFFFFVVVVVVVVVITALKVFFTFLVDVKVIVLITMIIVIVMVMIVVVVNVPRSTFGSVLAFSNRLEPFVFLTFFAEFIVAETINLAFFL
ncbi:Hypothetical Protein FCC1311_091802 [Hondaea fermentalgiana]|uniref:Uncharacterized protein n=1 Tax=Hondaea fermentalgiana TaxID=2315210 RepID=A0A2R5GYA2_9STRA|nr:Hypothetical Protein FCC1311_091802 [Hondaea fermentalgiana]|eukprot:GBG32954.1 Hypothetical Protein FCC1311_091802 [Hondaea fermentalgiana]